MDGIGVEVKRKRTVRVEGELRPAVIGYNLNAFGSRCRRRIVSGLLIGGSLIARNGVTDDF